MKATPDLNERAARLMYPDPDHKITSLGRLGVRVEASYAPIADEFPFVKKIVYDFLNDLNAATELWFSAPYEVQSAIELSIMEKHESDLDRIHYTIGLFTDPMALTEAVVEEWERRNADREERTEQ